ncbi:MAG: hypothetical protein ACQESS_02400 [Bacillota bacterium]
MKAWQIVLLIFLILIFMLIFFNIFNQPESANEGETLFEEEETENPFMNGETHQPSTDGSS